jgi:hypothetical protein
MITPPIPQGTFRRRELESLLGVLAARQPAVVVITGDPGMGKTSLLADFRVSAVAQGWSAVGGGRDRLSIDPRMGEPDLRRALLGTADAPPAPGPSAPGPEPFVKDLARHAPLLLLIDDYRPSPAFGRWFETDFLRAVLRCGTELVVAMAKRPGTRPLEAVATEVLDLGPLDDEVVRSALETMLPPLEPALSPTELEHYVRGANSPAVLASLIRVLSLGGPVGAPPP